MRADNISDIIRIADTLPLTPLSDRAQSLSAFLLRYFIKKNVVFVDSDSSQVFLVRELVAHF